MKKSNVVIIVILLAVAVFGILGITASMRSQPPRGATTNKQFIDVPLIKTSVVSKNTGESHSVDVDFYIKVTEGKENSVNTNSLYKRINSIVSGLDYESISSEDNVDYLIDSVKSNIDDIVPKENLEDVYINDITVDVPLEAFKKAEPKQNAGRDPNAVFNGLFKNANNQ